MQTTLEMIQDFLSAKRIAMVGISRNPKDFSDRLFEEFCRQGYDMVPVNPSAQELHARKCFPRLQAIDPPVEAVLLMTPPAVTEAVIGDCIEAHIRRVWMYRAGSQGAVSEAAVQKCLEAGIRVVPGECPFMFLRDVGVFHRFHGFVRKVTGRYPHSAAA